MTPEEHWQDYYVKAEMPREIARLLEGSFYAGMMAGIQMRNDVNNQGEFEKLIARIYAALDAAFDMGEDE